VKTSLAGSRVIDPPIPAAVFKPLRASSVIPVVGVVSSDDN
jgi:hypothetical protein